MGQAARKDKEYRGGPGQPKVARGKRNKTRKKPLLAEANVVYDKQLTPELHHVTCFRDSAMLFSFFLICGTRSRHNCTHCPPPKPLLTAFTLLQFLLLHVNEPILKSLERFAKRDSGVRRVML